VNFIYFVRVNNIHFLTKILHDTYLNGKSILLSSTGLITLQKPKPIAVLRPNPQFNPTSISLSGHVERSQRYMFSYKNIL
jgi:hypothetical protein